MSGLVGIFSRRSMMALALMGGGLRIEPFTHKTHVLLETSCCIVVVVRYKLSYIVRRGGGVELAWQLLCDCHARGANLCQALRKTFGKPYSDRRKALCVDVCVCAALLIGPFSISVYKLIDILVFGCAVWGMLD